MPKAHSNLFVCQTNRWTHRNNEYQFFQHYLYWQLYIISSIKHTQIINPFKMICVYHDLHLLSPTTSSCLNFAKHSLHLDLLYLKFKINYSFLYHSSCFLSVYLKTLITVFTKGCIFFIKMFLQTFREPQLIIWKKNKKTTLTILVSITVSWQFEI